MQQVTRRGVYNDLSLSPYKFKTEKLTLFFSSAVNLKRFRDALDQHLILFAQKCEKYLGVPINDNTLSILMLYHRIEGRGWRVIDNGVNALWLNELALNGNLEKRKP